MVKKDYKLLGVATIIGVAAVAAYFYLNSEDDLEVPAPVVEQRALPQNEPAPAETPATIPTVETPPVVVEQPPQEKPKPVEHVDNVLKEKQDRIARFKNLIQLEVKLPDGMDFVELDLDDGVAAMEGNAPGRKMLILAAQRTASPELIAGFLRDQKNQIPMLTDHDFKISGDVKNVAPPKDSGISRITVIPGGSKNGNQIYAAYLERADKRGSYVFVMEANPSQFTQYEGDFDIMTDSLKTK